MALWARYLCNTTLDAAALGIVSAVGIQNLTGLSSLNLSGSTAFSDVHSVWAETGFGTDDVVDLRNTDVPCDFRIVQMELRGVFVYSACQVRPYWLPAAHVNVAYSRSLATRFGGGNYTWELINATTLPTGLNLAANGDITGTPTVVGRTNFTVKVTNSAGQSWTKALLIPVQ